MSIQLAGKRKVGSWQEAGVVSWQLAGSGSSQLAVGRKGFLVLF